MFFFSFLAYHNPDWIEIMSEWCFLNFWIFFRFFWEFSCSGWVGTEFGMKIFFSLFLDLSHPDLDRNNAGMMFFNFLNFFAIFFGIFFLGSGRNEIQDENLFFSFLAYLSPVWVETWPEWFFCYFFGIF